MRTRIQVFMLTTFLCFLLTGLHAQPEFGVKAGLNLANVRFGGYFSNPSSLVTFKVGGVVDLIVSETVSVQPGLFINSKGFKYSNNTSSFTLNPIYFDIPILLLGKIDIGGVVVFGGMGPYIGFGFGGKVKDQSGSGSFNNNIRFGNTPQSDFKSVDFGLEFSGGVEFEGGITLGISYDFGLINVIPKENIVVQNGSTAQYRILVFSIGYFF